MMRLKKKMKKGSMEKMINCKIMETKGNFWKYNKGKNDIIKYLNDDILYLQKQ